MNSYSISRKRIIYCCVVIVGLLQNQPHNFPWKKSIWPIGSWRKILIKPNLIDSTTLHQTWFDLIVHKNIITLWKYKFRKKCLTYL